MSMTHAWPQPHAGNDVQLQVAGHVAAGAGGPSDLSSNLVVEHGVGKLPQSTESITGWQLADAVLDHYHEVGPTRWPDR